MGRMINRRRVYGSGEKLPYFVDMGLPSGTLWATRNIDVTQPNGFAASPYQYECTFFSWGNIEGHNPISATEFDYDWGGINSQEPYYEGQPYGDTPGSTLTTNIPVNDTYDAARYNLGTPWRIPTREDYYELLRNIIYINEDGTEISSTDKRITINGVIGVYCQSIINGQRLFLACSGNPTRTNWYNKGFFGFYWTSTYHSSASAYPLDIRSSGVKVQYSAYRLGGYPIRPVMNTQN